MSSFPLRKRLETLECHFTWDFEARGPLDIGHQLQTLTIRIKHTPYHNQAMFYALQAYLHQREGKYQDALQSLQKAEEILSDSHQSNFKGSVLVTYGNYAWIYYHLCAYATVEQYLDKISDIYTSLNPPTQPASFIPEINAVKGWSLLALGYENGEVAEGCFQKALAADPNSKELQAGLAIALYAATTTVGADRGLTSSEKAKLQEASIEEPINYEVRVCLMQLLRDSDRDSDNSEAAKLAADTEQKSQDPEVLRNVSRFYGSKDANRQIEILKRAISLDDTYYLLYKTLGLCYLKQLHLDKDFKDPNILSAGIQAFIRVIELVPTCMLAKMCLAELHRLNRQPHCQNEIYAFVEEDLPNLSQKDQQEFYLGYGKFQLYQKKSLDAAADLLMRGFEVLRGTIEGEQCRKQLLKIVDFFRRDNKIKEADEISRRIQQ